MNPVSFTPDLQMVSPAEGISLWVVGILVTIKALANETGGTYSLFEVIVPPGGGIAAHFHTREEETSYMVDGEMTWNVGGKSFRATKGCFVHLPRNVPHSGINNSNKPAHLLLTCAPGGCERFFLQLGEPVADRYAPGGPPPLTPDLLEKTITLGEEYGITFLDHHESKDEL